MKNIFQLFKKNSPKTQLLIIADVLDASYNVFLAQALTQLKMDGTLSFQTLSAREMDANTRLKKVRSLISSPKITDVIFLRYSQEDGQQLLNICKEASVRTYYFIDDDFFTIAKNAVSEILANHTSETSLSMRESLLKSVDQVLCSTTYLKQSLDKRFSLKNSLAPFYPVFFKQFPEQKLNGKTIGYMGSKGHKFDLELVVPAIKKMMMEDATLRFETFGSIQMPAELQEFKERVASYTNAKSYEDFVFKLSHLGWSVGIAPVESNEVNSCKAFTKFIEYTSANIPCIASDTNVYKQVVDGANGLLSSDNQWFEKLDYMLNTDKNTFLAKARETVKEYSVAKQAEKLNKVLVLKEKI